MLKTLISLTLMSLLSACATGHHHLAGSNDLTGHWQADQHITILQDKSDNLTVTINQRGPFKGVVKGQHISVDFSDDYGCCTGFIEHDTIHWSNGTSWSKSN